MAQDGHPGTLSPIRGFIFFFALLITGNSYAATTSHTASGEVNLWFRIWQDSRLIDQHQGKTKRWEQRLSKRPRDLEIFADRAEPYLAYIYEQIQARGLPAELALLPAVESGFDPFAYSQGRASGLWQFVPGTAKYLGLESNWWYDSRRDVIASTQTALDYLEKLYAQFDDWLLAVAAYNGGPGRIQGLIRKNRKRGKPTDFWSLPITGETAAYVPRWLATVKLMTHPSLMKSVQVAPLERHIPFTKVNLPGQMDLALAAELCDCSINRLYRLNPGLSRWATPPDGPNHLLIPLDRQDRFQRRLAKLDRKKLVRWTLHQIQSGETLSEIAVKYNTTVPVLRTANQISGNRIRAGKKLLIPRQSGNNKEYALSASERLKTVQATRRGKIRITHKVAPGDTLWDLSKKYGSSVQSIARWNGMAPGDALRIGQELTLWQKKANAQQSRTVYYTVRSGDTLSQIAHRFQVSVNELRRWNSIRSTPRIFPGDQLRIVVDVLNQFSET